MRTHIQFSVISIVALASPELADHLRRVSERSAIEQRRRLVWGDACERIAAEVDCSPDDVETVLDAGANEDQARGVLHASKEFNILPLAVWDLHQRLTRAQ